MSSLTPEQVQKLLTLIEPSNLRSEKLLDKTRIIDSGASHHMAGQLELLQDVRDSKPTTVLLPNGAQVNAIKHGNTALGPNLLLKDVLYVPILRGN